MASECFGDVERYIDAKDDVIFSQMEHDEKIGLLSSVDNCYSAICDAAKNPSGHREMTPETAMTLYEKISDYLDEDRSDDDEDVGVYAGQLWMKMISCMHSYDSNSFHDMEERDQTLCLDLAKDFYTVMCEDTYDKSAGNQKIIKAIDEWLWLINLVKDVKERYAEDDTHTQIAQTAESLYKEMNELQQRCLFQHYFPPSQ